MKSKKKQRLSHKKIEANYSGLAFASFAVALAFANNIGRISITGLWELYLFTLGGAAAVLVINSKFVAKLFKRKITVHERFGNIQYALEILMLGISASAILLARTMAEAIANLISAYYVFAFLAIGVLFVILHAHREIGRALGKS